MAVLPPPPPPEWDDDWDDGWNGGGPDPGDGGSGGPGSGGSTPPTPPSERCDGADCDRNDECYDDAEDEFCSAEEAADALALCRITYPFADLEITEWDSKWRLETGTTFDPVGRSGHYCALMPEIQQTGAMTVTKNGQTEQNPRIIADSFTIEPDGLKITQGIITGFWCQTLESGSIGLSSVHEARFLYVLRGSLRRSTPRRATDQVFDSC